MRLTAAAPAALRAAGLRVVELAGWLGRDNGNDFSTLRGLTVHHTAGSRNSSVDGELNVLVNGRPGLSGPISQFMVSRDGTWYCVAAGSANHNKKGFAGPNEGYGNSHLIGVECQHSGGSEPWTAVQYNSVVTGVAALALEYGFPVSHIAGHKEHQPGEKTDPSFSMSAFRDNVEDRMENMPVALTEADKTFLKKAIKDEVALAIRATETAANTTAADVWAHELTNPYSGAKQSAGTLLRYAPSRTPHDTTQALLADLAELIADTDAGNDTQRAEILARIAEVRQAIAEHDEPDPEA